MNVYFTEVGHYCFDCMSIGAELARVYEGYVITQHFTAMKQGSLFLWATFTCPFSSPNHGSFRLPSRCGSHRSNRSWVSCFPFGNSIPWSIIRLQCLGIRHQQSHLCWDWVREWNHTESVCNLGRYMPVGNSSHAESLVLTWKHSQNPELFQISSTCALVSGFYYCVQVNFNSTVTSTTSSLSTFVTSKASNTLGVSSSTVIGDGLSTPSPIQTGMTNICYSYHLVESGDTCAAITSDAGIALTDFYSWNPAVGTDCANLDIGDYVCIKILGYGISVSAVSTARPTSSKAVSTSATSSTSTGNGITTPMPIQTGMISTCDSFYLVVSGDSCSDLATSQGISLTNFYAWNPAVGTSCE